MLAAQPQPLWIQTAAGVMTSSSLKADVVAHLAFVGGGSYGNSLVAPNSLQEYGNVTTRLSHVKWIRLFNNVWLTLHLDRF
jgi:hypothetical protein